MNNPTAMIRPSFFKPLIRKDYSTILRLPIGFVRKHSNVLPEIAKLRVLRSGKSWNVEIEGTDDDEECFFTEGWSGFVKDLELRRKQMLLFWFNAGDGTFDVSVYGSDFIERAVNFRGSSSHVVVDESTNNEGERDECRPRFQFTLTKSKKARLSLLKEFAKAAGLIGKTNVVLQYLGRERYWAVVLKLRMPPNSTLDLAVGWNDFRVGNNLEFGRIYSFEFNFARNLIMVSDCNSTSDQLGTGHVWRFVKKVNQYHLSLFKMYVPKPFVAGIGIAEGDNINLEDSRGTKKWPVTVNGESRGKHYIVRGLKDFLREIHVQVGDILLFESVPNSADNVVKVVVKENEVGKQMLARSGRGGILMF